MTTFYLDFEGGDDTKDGLSFANRWKSITSGATAARIAPGDTIRVMASPAPSLVGDCAWTNKGATVTIPAAVTAVIDNCNVAWTASASVTQTLATANRKEGTNNIQLVIATAFTTGKVAYHATGALDLSAYQQVSFWFQTSAALAANTLRLCLCSDTTGDTVVHSFVLPAVNTNGLSGLFPLTIDNGAPLSASIQSVALYADADPGSVTLQLDHIIACKAPSAADALTLTSLIGKAHNLNWQAATAYSLNDIRKPTTVNRNGYAYKVTTAGTTGATEPAWPLEIGVTVNDGGVVWTCYDLEETWWPIMSIAGTTVKLDQVNSIASTATRGYYGATETAATYRREPITYYRQGTNTVGGQQVTNEAGTEAGGDITYSGGWSRTDMSVQDGETWLDRGYGSSGSQFFSINQFSAFEHFGLVRAGLAFLNSHNCSFRYCHVVGSSSGFYMSSANGATRLVGCAAVANTNGAYNPHYGCTLNLERSTIASNASYGVYQTDSNYNCQLRAYNAHFHNNGNSAVYLADKSRIPEFYNCVTSDNVNGLFNSSVREALMVNCLLGEGVMTGSVAYNGADVLYRYQKAQQTDGDHRCYVEDANWRTATDQRYTASGYSIKVSMSGYSRGRNLPVRVPLGKFYCTAGVTKTFSVMMRRSATAIKAKLVVPAAQLAGIPTDAESATFSAAINTWATSGTVSITPTESGVVELFAYVWDGTTTGNILWIDDLTVS